MSRKIVVKLIQCQMLNIKSKFVRNDHVELIEWSWSDMMMSK